MAKKEQKLSGSASERVELYRIDQRYRTLRTALRCLFGLFAVYYLRDIFEVLAGKTTRLAFELAVLADFKLQIVITLAGVAAVWALVERRIRHRKVEHLQDRIKQLETRIDPKRTTSGLTPSGKTHPMDR